jgi:hypothetical protein
MIEKGCPLRDLADSVPCARRRTAEAAQKMTNQISVVVDWIHTFSMRKLRVAPTLGAQISSAAGNNYARFGAIRGTKVFTVQIHAHGLVAATGMLLARYSRHLSSAPSSQCLMP